MQITIRNGHVQRRFQPPLISVGSGKQFRYADPPYIGQAQRLYDGEEINHRDLLMFLDKGDGWVLHFSVPSLNEILAVADDLGLTGYRVMAWVKPFCAFKRNVSVAYAWEPILVKPVRKPVVTGREVMRDYVSEPITMKRGLAGAKPERVCHWLFEVAGLHPDDEFVDMYPGTGAVTEAWGSWRAQFES